MKSPHALSNVWPALVWGPLRANWSRTLLALVAIALGVALGFAIFSMNRAAGLEVSRATRSLFGEADLSVQSTREGFDEALFPIVATTPGVALATPVIEMTVRTAASNVRLTALGIDLLRESRLQLASGSGAGRTRDGLQFFDPNSVMLSASAARTLQLDVDDELRLQVGSREVRLKVVGILLPDAYPQPLVLMDIATAQWRLDALRRLTRIHVRIRPTSDAASVRRALEDRLPNDVMVSTPVNQAQQSRQLSRAFTTNLTALALVALFTGGFLVYSTQSLAVMRRRRELALLHALGVTTRQQIAAVVWTGGLLGVLGSLIGILVGVWFAEAGTRIFFGSLGVDNFLPRIAYDAREIAAFLVLGIAVSIVGSLAPALAAARIPTAQALKSGDIDQSPARTHALAGLLLWLAAPFLLLLPPVYGLPLLAYVAIALILFGAVLLIPTFTRWTLRLLPQVRSATAQTAFAQLRGAAGTATVSVAAILVSVSLMVAMGIMITSLRGSYADSIDRALPADVYVTAGSTTDAGYIEQEIATLIAALPSVQRATAIRTTEVVLLDRDDTATLVARELDIDNPGAVIPVHELNDTAVPAGAVPIWVSVALADQHDYRSGDSVRFSIDGREVLGVARGIWRDNSRSTPSFAMRIDDYRRLSGDTRANSVGVWLRDGSDLEEALQGIRTALPPDSTVQLGLPADLRERQLRGFDRVFAITYVLQAIAVVIGLFGISVNASAQALARRAEFGMLRHLGFTRRQIGSVLAIEGLCLGTLGAIGSLIVGGVISLVLIHVVGRQSFYWSMDLHVPYGALTVLTVAVPLAAALTSVVSGRSAMSTDVIRAVKEDW